MLKVPGIGLSAALLLVSFASAQNGADDCASATSITGVGLYSFDNTGYTIDGPADCFGSPVRKDMWYAWTATTTGLYIMSSCSNNLTGAGATFDTKIVIYDGLSCSSFVQLDCAEESCEVSGISGARVTWSAVAGQQYLLRLGARQPFTAGFGAFEILLDPCDTLTDDGLEDNDTFATALPLAPGTWTNLLTTSGDPDFYSFTLQSGERVDMITTLASSMGDIDFRIYDSSGTLLADVEGPDPEYINLSSGVETVVFEVYEDPGNGFACGQYDMTIVIGPDPCFNLQDDAFEDNDTCATAADIGDGTYLGLALFAHTDLDMFRVTIPDGAVFVADLMHTTSNNCTGEDIDMFLYDASAGSCNDDPTIDPINSGELASAWTCADNEILTWTNATGSGMTCLLRISIWPDNVASGCSSYDLTLSGTGAVGPNLYCSPANPNSSGLSATLGTSSMSGPGVFHLDATQGPIDQFGYFLVAATGAEPGISVSQGMLCLSPPFGRYTSTAGSGLNSLGRFDANGVMQNLVGTSSTGAGFDVPATLPAPPGGTILPGSTWDFQLWYRDLGGASNFSDAISVDF